MKAELTGKQFLLIVAVLALIGWRVGNDIYGPPGLSEDYLEQYKADHEHYLEIVKSIPYKKYEQRPHLNDPADSDIPGFEERVAFVEEYEQREAYQEELHRIHTYELFFEIFNAFLVIAIAIRFGWRPLVNMLDTRIADLRERMEARRKAREAAVARAGEAAEKLESLPEEEERMVQESERTLIRELEELRELHHARLQEVKQELADQRDDLVKAEERKLRRQLFDQAVAGLEAELSGGVSAEVQDAYVEDFTQAVEGARR